MLNRFNKTAIIAVIIGVLLVSACTAAVTTTLPGAQSLTVTRGDLNIIVSTNGNLNMPDEFGLRFGTTGKVKDILVKEGDEVKQGSILAFLDDTAQKNSIKTALFNLRAVISNVAYYSTIETIPELDQAAPEGLTPAAYKAWVITHRVRDLSVCDTDILNKYPDLSAPRMAEEAQKALASFIDKYSRGLKKDAGTDLASTYLYIEVCEDVIKTKLDPDVISGAKKNPAYPVEITPGTQDTNDGTDREDAYKYTEALDYLGKYKARILEISKLIMTGDANKAMSAADLALQDMKTVNELVGNTVNLVGWDFLKFTDIPTTLNFLQASLRSLDDVSDYSNQADARADKISQMLYLAKLNLSTSRNVLENQEITYWGHQFTWQSLQQYNLNVQTAEIVLQKTMREILNTVIVAPSDGTVVSVGLKKDYILSAQDYSSRVAVDIVNTKKIKFTGMVDEIDILKVKKDQPATLTVDAVPDKKFKGKVKFISPYGTKVGNVVKFAVTIELEPTDVELRGMLSTSADIAVFTAGNVLLVPVSALNTGADGYTVNVVRPDGKVETRKVTIGKQNYTYAEVLSGLNEGEKLQASTAKPNAKPNQRPPGP